MTINEQTHVAVTRGWQKLVAVAALVGGLASSSCCILPLALFSLGVSGVWIGNFTQLAPYQPWFMAATVVFLGCGYWLVYWSPRLTCAADDACARTLRNRLVKCGLVVATILVAVAIGFNLLAPLLLES